MTIIRVPWLALIATGVILVSFPMLADIASPQVYLKAPPYRWHPPPRCSSSGQIQVVKGGGVLAPESLHQRIRLDCAEVIIRLKGHSYVVDSYFTLFNTGETATECTRFPKLVASRIDSFPTFIRFKGSANGRQMVFSEKWDPSGTSLVASQMRSSSRELFKKPMKEERQWIATRIVFPGHARTQIHVTYEAPYCGHYPRAAAYLYGTGCFWKGNIREAVFIVDASGLGSTEPMSIEFSEGSGNVDYVSRPLSREVMMYTLSNFEPSPEAVFRFARLDAPPPLRVHIRK